jgi:hypothetical protein
MSIWMHDDNYKEGRKKINPIVGRANETNGLCSNVVALAVPMHDDAARLAPHPAAPALLFATGRTALARKRQAPSGKVRWPARATTRRRARAGS